TLLGQRHDCRVYGDNVRMDGIQPIDLETLRDWLDDPGNAVLYHHSIQWENGEEILNRARARIIFRYHNIIPPDFFHPYDAGFSAACRRGRQQTERFTHRHPHALWLADSHFNLSDAGREPGPRAAVVPPFNNIDRWGRIQPREEILKGLAESDSVNILFVGRVVPNKGYRHLLDVVADYVRHYGGKIRLHLAGKRLDHFRAFHGELEAHAAQLGIAPQIHWMGEVDDATLLSYYLGCDIYLSLSLHEGFGLPLVEAQSLHLPVIAKDAAAVGETLGPGQLLLGHETQDYSAAIHVLAQRGDLAGHLVNRGLANYRRRFTNEIIAQQLTGLLSEYLGEQV
ncbi:MAG: glycosyltransferase family 4 protein, partial [Acidobacteriota bacterium]